tara:strand:+ start:234 stop:422 length:189 start_codon:yes stop_codon:yes gene_type:complete
MTAFRKIESIKNAATFLSFILAYHETFGMNYVPPLLLSEYQEKHKHIEEGLKHLLNYLEEEK